MNFLRKLLKCSLWANKCWVLHLANSKNFMPATSFHMEEPPSVWVWGCKQLSDVPCSLVVDHSICIWFGAHLVFALAFDNYDEQSNSQKLCHLDPLLAASECKWFPCMESEVWILFFMLALTLCCCPLLY